jgi:predicted transcriptional regulator
VEEPVADAPAEEDIQAQIEALKKHNQEMQAQIEVLKKKPTTARTANSISSGTPREGVLIINGKNTKESVQGLKSVIESMNAASGTKDTGK